MARSHAGAWEPESTDHSIEDIGAANVRDNLLF